MTEKTFILGMGAAKSGTTWIYDYVKRFPQVDLGFRKEYFIWDAVTLPPFSHFRVQYGHPIINAHQLLRREMQTYPEAYFGYFSALLNQENVSISADLTASYTGLASDTLDQIREGFAARGIRCKIIFMMRDPVERCHSMIRMFKQKGFPRWHLGLDLEQDEDKLLLQYHITDHCHSLTQYERAFENIQRAGFRPEDVFYGLYESFFNESELDRFVNFLDLPFDVAQLARKSNSTDRKASLSDDVRLQVAKTYSSTYRASKLKFPEVEELWPGVALLASENII